MTTIKINKNEIEINGHSEYATEGYDIICSAISTMIQFLINLCGLPYKEKDGYYKVNIMKCRDDRYKTIALNTYIDMAKELSNQYPQHVEVIYDSKTKM
jgi:uncharacterized protein YsxB (DUF464 family)